MTAFFKKHVWVLVLIMCVITIPQSLTTQAELKMRVLITGVALDKVEEQYELTAQVVMPSQSTDGNGVAKVNFVTAQAQTVSEALNKVAYMIGKTVGVSHLSYVIVGESLKNSHLPTVLDFFLRSRHINNALVVMRCDGTAKEMLSKTQNFELGTGVGLQKLFFFKQNASNGFSNSIQEFVNGASTKSASAMLSFVDIKEDDVLKNDSTQNTPDATMKGRVEYMNKIAYYKNGKEVGQFTDEDEIMGVMLMNKKCKEVLLTVENINDDIYQNAIINLFVRNKKTSTTTKFKDGVANVDVKIKLDVVEYREIQNTASGLEDYKSYTKFLTNAVKKAVEEKTKTCITLAFEKAKQDSVDVFEFLNKLYRFDAQNYKKAEKENGADAILQNLKLNISVEVDKIA